MILRVGSSGDTVRQAQRRLNEWMLAEIPETAPIEEDGFFGLDTEYWTRSYQRAHGLEPDGVIGPETARKMVLALEE